MNYRPAIFIGRFQGVTKAHKKIINFLIREHRKVYIILVNGRKTSKIKKDNPFDINIRKLMLSKINNMMDIVTVENGFIPNILKKLKEDDFVLYAGPDRYDGYLKQIKYCKGKNITVEKIEDYVNVDRKVYKATYLRESLKEGSLKKYKYFAPKEIWGLFNTLKGAVSNG